MRLGEWLAVVGLLCVAVTTTSRPPSENGERAPIWRESWSQRFPGCVATVLWPPAERPVAVVTRDPAGRVARIDAGRAAVDDARTVGACRRPREAAVPAAWKRGEPPAALRDQGLDPQWGE